MRVVATNIGERRTLDWKGTLLETGIFKTPVSEIFLEADDVKDDAVVDRKYHGGTNKAVYAYNSDYYPYWEEKYPDLDWDYGMFGENLSIEGLVETQICIGNQYKIGEAIIEVTEPREPCVKLGARFNDAKIVKEFWKDTKSGVYFKVLQNGKVKAGDTLELLFENKNSKTIAQEYESRK